MQRLQVNTAPYTPLNFTVQDKSDTFLHWGAVKNTHKEILG